MWVIPGNVHMMHMGMDIDASFNKMNMNLHNVCLVSNKTYNFFA